MKGVPEASIIRGISPRAPSASLHAFPLFPGGIGATVAAQPTSSRGIRQVVSAALRCLQASRLQSLGPSLAATIAQLVATSQTWSRNGAAFCSAYPSWPRYWSFLARHTRDAEGMPSPRSRAVADTVTLRDGVSSGASTPGCLVKSHRLLLSQRWFVQLIVAYPLRAGTGGGLNEYQWVGADETA
jgi:hypothetical protein